MDKNVVSGIYTITNLVNNKIYVGLATDIYDRFTTHLNNLRNKTHRNCHLQLAFDKYGESNFEFDILIECSKDILFSEENYWCNLLNTHNDRFGYNIRPTSPNGKYKISEETKIKIGKANKGKGLGKTLSLETRQKMSNSFRGRKMSKEFCNNLKLKNIGKVYSEETKKKMSISKTGKRMKCHHIPVILVDHINNLETKFECITDLAKYLNCATTQISKVISGKQKTVCGFKVIKHE